MAKRFQNILFGGFILLFGALLTILYFVGIAVNDQESDMSSLWYEHEVVTSLEETLSSLQRAESSRRGYIITHDSEYVSSYRGSVGEVQQAILYLRQLNAQRLYDDSFLALLESRVDSSITLLNSSIKISMGKNSSDSIQVVMTSRGTEIMRSIRTTILQMLRDKRNSRDDHYRAFASVDVRIRSILRLGLIAVTILLSALGLTTYLYVRRLTMADGTLRFDLFQARYQAQHATSRYQDLKSEVAEKQKPEEKEDSPTGS